ncbi:unnamed protein product [Rhizophagus irregularis]|nr:unnamed protein product [Rhizophagus irregularis]
MSSSNNSNTVLSPIDLNVLSSENMMRECLYEKNVDFALNYRIQKTLVTSQVVRAFKKKAPDFPITAGDWAVKEMLISTIQRKLQEEAAQEVQEKVAR